MRREYEFNNNIFLCALDSEKEYRQISDNLTENAIKYFSVDWRFDINNLTYYPQTLFVDKTKHNSAARIIAEIKNKWKESFNFKIDYSDYQPEKINKTAKDDSIISYNKFSFIIQIIVLIAAISILNFFYADIDQSADLIEKPVFTMQVIESIQKIEEEEEIDKIDEIYEPENITAVSDNIEEKIIIQENDYVIEDEEEDDYAVIAEQDKISDYVSAAAFLKSPPSQSEIQIIENAISGKPIKIKTAPVIEKIPLQTASVIDFQKIENEFLEDLEKRINDWDSIIGIERNIIFYIKNKMYDNALALAENTVDANEESKYIFYLSVCMYLKNDFNGAVQLLSKTDFTKNKDLLKLMILSNYKMNNIKAAEKYYSENYKHQS